MIYLEIQIHQLLLLQLLLPFDWLVETCVYPEHTNEITQHITL